MEDHNNDWEYFEWLNSLPDDERDEYVQRHSTILEDGQEDPTIIHLKEGETIEDWMQKNGFIDATEIIEQMKNL